MADTYYLTCSCGKKISVVASQAGQTLTCECGAKVEVPTMRQLIRQAEHNTEAPKAVHQVWGVRERVLMLGTILLAAGLLWTALGVIMRPGSPRPTPLQTMLLWDSLARGRLDPDPAPWSQFDQLQVAASVRLKQGLILTAFGLLVAGGAYLSPKGRPVSGC